MVSVPVVIPVTTPETEPMVATAGVLLLHIPGETESSNVVVPPVHVLNEPVIAEGIGLTVNIRVAEQPRV